ncbi:phospholipase A [Endozoicomonas sp. 4G]|uniref:phospholipase A n=1 Tax=Endozoicomonas sp. 4G TaxID=2872754 RepID=UPI002078F8F2|nr:phospholipase A [Endozoicomonas sp. 4G]
MVLSLSPALAFSSTVYEQCLLKQAMEADGQTTMAEIRAMCSKPSGEDIVPAVADDSDMARETEESAFDERLKNERQASDNRFVITPHRPNYVLPVSWNNNVNKKPYKAVGQELTSTEIKFQLSLKAPVWEGIWNGYGTVYAAYTNTSWWQAYNPHSAPFRETNHEPEIFAAFPVDYSVLGLDLRAVVAGLSHQSNGRSGNLSRSWNRIYLTFLLEKGNFYMSFKPWYRIPEPEKEYPYDPDGDDNPDIEQYMGNGELHFGYKLDEHQLGMMLRNNLRSDNKGAVQLDWSFPINERFRGYVQYFNGYGESLIDYNASVNRISVGVMLTDWL